MSNNASGTGTNVLHTYAAGSPAGSVTTTTTAGSATATVSSAAGLAVGMLVYGPNIPIGTTITAIVGTTLTLSNNATTTGTNVPHTYFTGTPYASSSPPNNPISPGTGTNSAACSVCPAVFSANMCSDQYITYQMCVGNVYTISMCGAATAWNSVLAVTTVAGTALATNTPPSWNDDGCGTSGGHATLTYTPSVTGNYRIRLWNNTCTVNGGQCGTVQIACNPVPPPPLNDEPANATNLGSPAPTTCTMVSGTVAWATQSAGTPSGCTAGGCATASGSFSGYDVWYSVGVPASGNLSVILQEISANNLAFAVYTGVPGALTIVANSCNCNDFVSLSGLVGGTTVYIRVWPQTGAPNMGSFQLCAYEPIPPPNDSPCGATGPYALPVPTSCGLTPFSTQNATALPPLYTAPAPSCGTPVAGGDVWFAAVMPATGSMTINTQAGTLSDMAMTVYTVTAGTMTTNCATQGAVTLAEVGCNDNFGANPMPNLTIGGTPGVTYYIRMWNKTTAFGTASICAVQNVPPPNDNPCGAIALQVNNGCYFQAPFSTQFATITGGTAPSVLSIPNPSCNGGPYNSDVWFTATVPASGQLVLDTDDMQLTDGGYAVYTATGTCGGNNLSLTQVPAGNGGCSVGGSTNGAAMPTSTVTGLTPGATVYIRVWRQSGNDGNFLLCARNPATPPPCSYTLRLQDSAGDGWNGGFVTLCINASCTNFTVFGSLSTVVFSAPLGANVTISYTPAGGFQNQVSFSLLANNGFTMFASSNPPASGLNHVFTVNSTCNVPPAPISDCIGAQQICNAQSFTFAPGNFGNNQDLSPTNRGCMLANERQGVWLRFTTNAAGTIAFNVAVTPGTDYDFALWGPYAGTPPCPPSSPPIRCNWSAVANTTGLSTTALNATEPAGGPPFSSALPVLANQSYLLYIDNYSMNGLSFTLNWNNTPNTILDCNLLPVEWLDLKAEAQGPEVLVSWLTASEQHSDYFRVDRSEDGTAFRPIGTVQAAGNSSAPSAYAFVDKQPVSGLNYYRVEQIATNGDGQLSPVVSVMMRAGGTLMVYPNPAGESLWASFESPNESQASWRIVDASGRAVAWGRTSTTAGMNQVELPLTMDAGSYLIELMDERGGMLGHARFVKR
ncbi:MAG: T9SS type A sorting domain-containing protein [Flavobacteriales bacterium]|nr:T9SS type A sorting domain-containing protein [Flavobacteriales bacterium]